MWNGLVEEMARAREVDRDLVLRRIQRGVPEPDAGLRARLAAVLVRAGLRLHPAAAASLLTAQPRPGRS